MVKKATVNQAAEILQRLDKIRRTTRLKKVYFDLSAPGSPYKWQQDYHNAGDEYAERMLQCANQVGKNYSTSAEVSMHLIGQYPDWWEGRRFDHPVDVLVASISAELVRDSCQENLLGKIIENRSADGTGWIPIDNIGPMKYRVCGVSDCVEHVKIKHISGGWSTVYFKSYEQEVEKFQAVKRHIVWMDEEGGNSARIFNECKTRLLVNGGIMMFTRTPLMGMTEIVQHFLDGGKGIYVKNATWDDAPHISPEQIEQTLASLPEHERDCRSKGVPMMGSGRVYPVREDDILVRNFQVKPWHRRIVGIDFGLDHPFAAVWLAYDADTDVVTVYDCYTRRREQPPIHASAIKRRGEWIPVAWPHDGFREVQSDKRSGLQLKDMFEEEGVNMLFAHATYEDDASTGVEPGVHSILTRMQTGRFKVAAHLDEWLREFRVYHRKTMDNGHVKIVDRNDDLMSATRYGVMMLRYAEAENEMMMPRTAENKGWNPFDHARTH